MSLHRGFQISYLLLLVVALFLWGVRSDWSVDRVAIAGPAKLNQLIPSLNLQDPKGKETITQASLRGQWTLLNYWATWCKPCREEMPSLERLARRLPKLHILAASVDRDWKDVQTFFRQHPSLGTSPLQIRLLWDPSSKTNPANNAQRFGIKKFPETYLVDPQGIIRFHYVGPFAWDSPRVMKHITMLMQGKLPKSL